MIKIITNTIRIKTKPLNWIVQKRNAKGIWVNSGYHDKLEWMLANLLSELAENKHEEVKMKIKEMVKELGIENEEDKTAHHLTRELKHPEFCRKIHPNSIKNIKNKAFSSSDFQRNDYKGISVPLEKLKGSNLLI